MCESEREGRLRERRERNKVVGMSESKLFFLLARFASFRFIQSLSLFFFSVLCILCVCVVVLRAHSLVFLLHTERFMYTQAHTTSHIQKYKRFAEKVGLRSPERKGLFSFGRRSVPGSLTLSLHLLSLSLSLLIVSFTSFA